MSSEVQMMRWTDRPVVGISLSAMAVGRGGIGINPHSPPSDDEIYYSCTAEPKARHTSQSP